ncbi:MAG: hypothetical protein Q8L14_19870 [Myxococcales bacterium]|nr:hypothetical protein [Myxococcales bacterium]
MPSALKIFVLSMLAGLVAGAVTLRFGLWVVERYFSREPMAFLFVLVATLSVGVASAVTSGVVMGRGKK